MEYPTGRDCCYDINRPSARHCGVKLTGESGEWVSDVVVGTERGAQVGGKMSGRQALWGSGAVRLEVSGGVG